MNELSAKMEVLEIPATTNRLSHLLEETQDLVSGLTTKIVSVVIDRTPAPTEPSVQGTTQTQLGGFIDEQNRKLETINDDLRSLISRIRL